MKNKRLLTLLTICCLIMSSLTSCGSDSTDTEKVDASDTETAQNGDDEITPTPMFTPGFVTETLDDGRCEATAQQGGDQVTAPPKDDAGNDVCPIDVRRLGTSEVDALVANPELGCPGDASSSPPPASTLDCSYTALMGLEVEADPPGSRSFRNVGPIEIAFDFTPTGIPDLDDDGNPVVGQSYTEECLRLHAAGAKDGTVALCDNTVEGSGPEQAAMAIYRVADQESPQRWEKAGDAYFFTTETAIGLVNHLSQLVLVKIPPAVDLAPVLRDGGETIITSAFSLRTHPTTGLEELTFVARFVAEGDQLRTAADGDRELIVVVQNPTPQNVSGDCADRPVDQTFNCLLGLDDPSTSDKVDVPATLRFVDLVLDLGFGQPIQGDGFQIHWQPSAE